MIKTLSLLAVLSLLASCAPGGYTREFARVVASQEKAPATPEGAWVGTWKSEVNGHHGPLWCLVSPNPDQPGHYDFRYRAGWGVIHFGDYTHTVATEPDAEGHLPLEGEMELPAGFGTYSISGTLTPTDFEADYRSKADRGKMILKRPE